MKWSCILILSISFILFPLAPRSVSGSGGPTVDISTEFIEDVQDVNELGPLPGGENIGAEWGELVVLKAVILTPFNRSIILMWNITNLADGNITIHRGNTLDTRFYPSNRRPDLPQSERFLVQLTVWYERTGEMAAFTSIQLPVRSDGDNDNDGLPDIRERYYWGDIIHHLPEDDEDGDGLTNIQEIGFQIPLSDGERSFPYDPRGGPFDPTDPDDPIPRNSNYRIPPKRPPNGPVMSTLASYSIVGGLGSMSLLGILFIIFYIVYGPLRSNDKESGSSSYNDNDKRRPQISKEISGRRNEKNVPVGGYPTTRPLRASRVT
ncbi:MAG: hypothetical protein JXA22_07500 [Candidatus Thermoplasmatota archaeon]|nr:hypothetical protein [Candidatus Thermoplasmatota archaeon]